MSRLLLLVAALAAALLAGSASAVRSLEDAPLSSSSSASSSWSRSNATNEAPDYGYKNTKPLIGILAQPCSDCPGRSYIAAGYVKWIESAGARAVPVRFYASDAELRRIFDSINGLVFPGGLTWLWKDSPYVIAARKLFDMATASNDAGDPFPIWGTCLGHQLLQILATNISRNDLLVETDSVGHPANLDFVADAAKASRLFGGIAPDLFEKLASHDYDIALENHMYGVPPQFYQRWPDLAEWYRVLSTTKDRNGLEYISTIEGVKYPFFGTQWHPEKPPFEFTMDEIPHTIDAIRVSQHLANVFVDTARKSSHAPRSHEEDLELQIYDTCPIFAARFEVVAEDNYDGPDSYYCFDTKERPPIGPDDAESDEDKKKHPPSAAPSNGGRAVGEDGHEAYSRRTNAALGIKVDERRDWGEAGAREQQEQQEQQQQEQEPAAAVASS